MVAEFVEDQQTLDLLKKIGVQYAQGYHLHRPESFVSFREHSVTS
jgi:EAL domain-containing protein (putative c-di-GMP-specific phosphodiesterase class I)